MQRETEADSGHDTSVEARLETQPSTSKAQSEYDEFLARAAPRNMSELKVMNGSFENFDHKKEPLLVLKVHVAP